jgi:hypothetical protein
MKNKTSIKNKFSFTKYSLFSTTLTPTTGGTVQPPTPPKKVHGGLKDQDRIFTNLYRDGDPFIEGAMKRVN